MSSSSEIKNDAASAPAPAIRIISLMNKDVIFTDIPNWVNEIKSFKIPTPKSFQLSLEDGENIESPLRFLRINDVKIPRWYIQLQMGCPVAGIEKLAAFFRNKGFYWLVSYIQIYEQGSEKCLYINQIENFFRRSYDQFLPAGVRPVVSISSASSAGNV